jgi:hypothetical protein
VSSAEKIPPEDLQLRIIDAAAALFYVALRRAAVLESSRRRAVPTTEPDRAALTQIGGALDGQLAEVEQLAEVLRRAFEEYGPWCNERIGRALETGQFGDAERAAFARATQATDGDYASSGTALASGLGERAGTERADLRARVDGTLEEAGLETTAHDIGCDLIALGTMGGLLTCPETAGAGCVVGAAGMIALVALC